MANDRDDFAPEIRNSAWWASDTRMVMNGKAVEVIMQKQGKIDPPDLSQIEAVQMGHVMQPIIGRLAQDRLNMELKDADYPLTHPDHSWLRSHFDFISADGRVLVEAKNYNINARNKFDVDSNRIPPADYAQILHEATVHRVDRVILAVLFGGQEFQTFDFTFTEEEKENLIKDMAVYWGHVKADTLPEPQSLEATKLIYPNDNGQSMVASQALETAIQQLKQIKGQIKAYEEQSDILETAIRGTMQNYGDIVSVSGETLVTWRSAKSSKRFSSDLFKQSMPEVYEQFVVEMPGSRRFLVK
jgi:predicted phage-related endonuclease